MVLIFSGSKQIVYSLDSFELLAEKNGAYSAPVNETCNLYVQNNDNLVFLNVTGRVFVWNNHTINKLEEIDILKFNTKSNNVEAWFDVQDTSRLLAGMDLVVLVVIIVLLILGNILLVRDANKLIIQPIEVMVALLKRLA